MHMQEATRVALIKQDAKLFVELEKEELDSSDRQFKYGAILLGTIIGILFVGLIIELTAKYFIK